MVCPSNMFWTGNLPSLVRNFSFNSFLLSLAKEAILICFIVAAFWHKSKSSALFSFAAITKLNASLLPIIFHSSTVNFEEFSLIITTVLNSLYP